MIDLTSIRASFARLIIAILWLHPGIAALEAFSARLKGYALVPTQA